MTSELIRTIVDRVNAPPFNLGVNLIGFDNLSPQRLLQLLSDVLAFVFDQPNIDVRTESPDQTAVRIFNELRIIRFRPPADLEQLEEWRIGIVEGAKTSIYPILEYIFSNTDGLKERAYLSRFLTRVEVPPEFQDVDTMQAANELAQLMEDFKEVHSRLTEIQHDSAMAEDIRTDLKSMESEREQLQRKIEKVERKVKKIPNLPKFIEMAAALRSENERLETLNSQKHEQRNAVVASEQRFGRLQQQLTETEKAGESIDPSNLIKNLKEEIDVNSYLANTKLVAEIDAKRRVVAELSKVQDLPAMDERDIKKLQEEIEEHTKRIMTLEEDRDRKEEGHDDNFSIYRHQAATIERKKAAMAQKLQQKRQELEEIELQLANRKRELREKSGGEDVITSVQFKNYVNKLRLKTNQYKKKRAEMEDLKAELQILTRSTEILSHQWSDLRNQIEEMGGEAVEPRARKQMERPRTAKPKSDDLNELK